MVLESFSDKNGELKLRDEPGKFKIEKGPFYGDILGVGSIQRHKVASNFLGFVGHRKKGRNFRVRLKREGD